MTPKTFHTYILRCADDTLYTGWTSDIEKRMSAHNSGAGAKYTRTRTPVSLFHVENFATKQEAMSREFEIKKLSRDAKLKLGGNKNLIPQPPSP